jgi:hypothetical protein
MINQIHLIYPCIVSIFDFKAVIDFSLLVAILSGARNSRDLILSEKIYKRMKSLFSDHKDALISGSILLGNVSSSLGDHQGAQDIRLNRIKELGKRVKVGISWTEVNGELVVRDSVLVNFRF